MLIGPDDIEILALVALCKEITVEQIARATSRSVIRAVYRALPEDIQPMFAVGVFVCGASPRLHVHIRGAEPHARARAQREEFAVSQIRDPSGEKTAGACTSRR